MASAPKSENLNKPDLSANTSVNSISNTSPDALNVEPLSSIPQNNNLVSNSTPIASNIKRHKPHQTSSEEKINRVISNNGTRQSEKEVERMYTDTEDLVEVDNLNAKAMYLPFLKRSSDLLPSNSNPEALLLSKRDSVTPKKPITFLVGLAFNPQLGGFQFQNNTSAAIPRSFSEPYLKSKKVQNALSFNFAWGLKAGIVIKDKWEVLIGFGFQRFNQKEKIEKLVPGQPMPTVTNMNLTEEKSLFAYNVGTVAEPGETYVNKYNYSDFSLEAHRIITCKKVFRLKMGMGFHMQHMLRKTSNIITVNSPDHYYYGNGFNSSINKWQSAITLKGGIIEDLSKTIQVQLCPNFFYSLNSMFKKEYVVKQKPYGLGVEASLFFKIR